MKSIISRTQFWLFIAVFAGEFALSICRAETVRVVTRNTPPFSYLGENGEWQGVAIELWEALASDLKLDYSIVEASSISDLLTGVQTGKYDLGVAGITITSEREKVIDFSQPYLASSLAAGYRNAGSPWRQVLRRVLSWDFLSIGVAFIVLLFVSGSFLWLAEHRKNPDFSANRGEGIGSGFWWAAVTMTTVGYGDKAPRTLAGRTIAVVWMFVSVVILSLFTATVVSSLTEGALLRHRNIEELLEARIGTVSGSTSETFLEQYNMVAVSYDSITNVVDALSRDAIDVIVYDLPSLQYYQKLALLDMAVTPIRIQRQDYGLVMPLNAKRRNDLNVALLKYIRSPEWSTICRRYLGHADFSEY